MKKQLRAACLLAAPISLAACTTAAESPADKLGYLNGVLAADAPSVIYVPVGVDKATGCTMYTKKPTREGIAVDAAIWYRATDGRFVIDAESCDPNAPTVHGGTDQ